MILDRFDAVVFIGDGMLKNVYASFNMLLREDIAMGGLKQWSTTEKDRQQCACDNQLIRWECSKFSVLSSDEKVGHERSSGEGGRPYYCDRKYRLSLDIEGGGLI